MDYLSNVRLVESQRQELDRQVEQARQEQGLPKRPMAWRVWLVMAILLVGMCAWWIH